MSHSSPETYLVWSILSGLLLLFLLFHLWSFDRFKCLRWNNGPYSGAFKRFMTYMYMITVPLIFGYATGFTIIKYKEGYTFIPGRGIIPTPYQLWTGNRRNAIFPLYLIFSLGWSFEMVTHLEELCFWLFLVNAGAHQQDWFRSLYFKVWVGGSIIACLYMPLVTSLSRHDLLKCEAFTFLAGSLGSLSLTLWFTPILWSFPAFLENMRRDGVDMGTIVRLTKFHELNTVRILFRFVFTVPFVILGVDGVRHHHHINENIAWTDFLAIMSGFGCVISSGITLVIFFPRSIEGEIAARDAKRGLRKRDSKNVALTRFDSHNSAHSSHNAGTGTYLLTSSPVKHVVGLPVESVEAGEDSAPFSVSQKTWRDESDRVIDVASQDSAYAPQPISMRPNRRLGGEVELGAIELTEGNVSKHNLRMSNVNPMVQNFTSPIDFMQPLPETRFMSSLNGSRYTFTQQ